MEKYVSTEIKLSNFRKLKSYATYALMYERENGTSGETSHRSKILKRLRFDMDNDYPFSSDDIFKYAKSLLDNHDNVRLVNRYDKSNIPTPDLQKLFGNYTKDEVMFVNALYTWVIEHYELDELPDRLVVRMLKKGCMEHEYELYEINERLRYTFSGK